MGRRTAALLRGAEKVETPLMRQLDLWTGEFLREQLTPARFCNFVSSGCRPGEPKPMQTLKARWKPPHGSLCPWQQDVPKQLPGSPDALVRKTNLSFSTV